MERQRYVPDPKNKLMRYERPDGSGFVNITCELAADLAARYEAGENVGKLVKLVYLAQHLCEAGIEHAPECPALTKPELAAELADFSAFVDFLMSEMR